MFNRGRFKGVFEPLVLQALQNDPVVHCAKAFRDCVTPHFNEGRTLAQRDKIAVQALLSAELGNAYSNVFKAQKAHVMQQLLNYEHAAFLPIKHFLEELLSEAEPT